MSAPSLPQLLTATQVAAAIGVHRRTFARMVARGEFPAPMRRNRRWARWPADDLARYLRHLDERRGNPEAN